MQGDDTIFQQYRALLAGPAWIDRSYRSLIEVTGNDRLAWAHNLTSNQVKSLGHNEGNYAFALNVQGRILFDLNLVNRAESIWIDLDGRFLQTALRHFNKYIIMEDVRLVDRSQDFVRAALAGEKAKSLLADLGSRQAAAMSAISMTNLRFDNEIVEVLRHDFCGEFSCDLFLPASIATKVQGSHPSAGKSVPVVNVADEAVQLRRIEAGIPWPGAEIMDDVLPAETRQMERAVSFQKGCYLGQEIVERMRARKVVARLLSGLKIDGDIIPGPGAEILSSDGAVVGKVTSACRSLALGIPIALAYLKMASATPGAELQIRANGQVVPAKVTDLPFVAPCS